MRDRVDVQLLDNGRSLRLLQCGVQFLLGHTRDLLQGIKTELATDDGGDGEDTVARFAEAGESLADDIAQNL